MYGPPHPVDHTQTKNNPFMLCIKNLIKNLFERYGFIARKDSSRVNWSTSDADEALMFTATFSSSTSSFLSYSISDTEKARVALAWVRTSCVAPGSW